MGVSGGLVSVTHLNMAYHGPSYGLSRECAMKAQAKFSPERAKECMTWIEEVTGQKLGDIKDQIDFAEHLKDGVQLCSLINALQPGSVKKINTLKAPFKQRENIEMYLKACTNYGLKEQDLFQVNDLTRIRTSTWWWTISTLSAVWPRRNPGKARRWELRSPVRTSGTLTMTF